MLILLPPSETKSAGRRGGRPMDASAVSFPGLRPTRDRVAAALAEVSARTDAPALLRVSPHLADEIARNTRLTHAPATAVSRLYTGVLYDALDVGSLAAAERRRANRWIVVVSALYGALRLTDRVAPYRLGMTATLPGLPKLAALWRPELDVELSLLVGRGLVVDCRSAAYVAAWPAPAVLADRWVHVRVPGAAHGAKHTRGLVARAICADGLDPRSVPDLAAGLARRFDVEAHEPVRRIGGRVSRPWSLEIYPSRRSTSQRGGADAGGEALYMD